MLAVDLYLSEHLTKKYEATSRPHVRMTRAPIRGQDLRDVDLVLASHKHSDHFDPGTLPELMAGSPGGPGAAGGDPRACDRDSDCPRSGSSGWTRATAWSAPAFAFARSRRPTKGSTPTQPGVIFTSGT